MFHRIFSKARKAVSDGIDPMLIPEGSSGSYFVYDTDGKTVGVFKPKDEEPFAELNPKWPKFFQRVLCFCCFGRACLIPNTGYLSEAGASVVDEMLRLNVVPTTRVVKLASPSFFYSRFVASKECWPKEGSFQLFVDGYENGTTVFARWNYDKNLLSQEEDEHFTILFQKMCILDYIIRNTDRHMNNLLIKHIPGQELKVAAIDNGLAFPVKHPEYASRFRTFPFRWARLRWADYDWNEGLRLDMLHRLTPQFVNELCTNLKKLFSRGNTHPQHLIKNQLRVMRGQIWNLREALMNSETPREMMQREPVLVHRRYKAQPHSTVWEECFRLERITNDNQAVC